MSEALASRPRLVKNAPYRCSVRQIAYDLWCIQEDRRISALPMESLDTLLKELRQRKPQITDALLQQGVDLFLQGQIDAQCERFTQRERQLFFLTAYQSRSLCLLNRANPLNESLMHPPASGACTSLNGTGYNESNGRATVDSVLRGPYSDRGQHTNQNKTAPP